jgi:hypothetical protein
MNQIGGTYTSSEWDLIKFACCDALVVDIQGLLFDASLVKFESLLNKILLNQLENNSLKRLRTTYHELILLILSIVILLPL